MIPGGSTGSMAGDVWVAVRVAELVAWLLGPVVGGDVTAARFTVAILAVGALLVVRWEVRAR